LLQARVSEYLASGDHLVGDAAETEGDFDVRHSGILAGEAPAFGEDPEVLIALDQVVGDAEDRGAQVPIATAHEAASLVDFVALIAGGIQAGAASDGAGGGVDFDRPHRAGELRRGDDVDAWDRQQQDIRGAGKRVSCRPSNVVPLSENPLHPT
jgi:hypothetical protein